MNKQIKKTIKGLFIYIFIDISLMLITGKDIVDLIIYILRKINLLKL
ncbi:MAG: hypothetical protein ACQERJ_02050 [Bacillota bacterium]